MHHHAAINSSDPFDPFFRIDFLHRSESYIIYQISGLMIIKMLKWLSCLKFEEITVSLEQGVSLAP